MRRGARESVSERARPPNAVLDANVLARFVLTPLGFTARLLDAIEAGNFVLITSEAILGEVADLLGRPHVQRYGPFPAKEIEAYARVLRRLGHVVRGRYTVFAVPHDPRDNHVLAAALEGNADFVVTDDRKHLLPLKHYHRIQIVSVPDFLRHHVPQP